MSIVFYFCKSQFEIGAKLIINCEACASLTDNRYNNWQLF